MHIDELQQFLHLFGFGTIQYDAAPVLNGEPLIKSQQTLEIRFSALIRGHVGIIHSDTHAVAWDGSNVFDPNRVARTVDDIQILGFGRFVRL